jgi:hypothetical protein
MPFQHPVHGLGLNRVVAYPFEVCVVRIVNLLGLVHAESSPISERSSEGNTGLGVGENRNLEQGRLPVDSKSQPIPKRAGSCSWDTVLNDAKLQRYPQSESSERRCKIAEA